MSHGVVTCTIVLAMKRVIYYWVGFPCITLYRDKICEEKSIT